MKTFQHEVQLRTAGGLSVTDITDQVREAVRESGIRNGICCVYSPHTTCSVRVNEWERGFLEDFAVMLQRLVPTEHYYAHDDWDQPHRERQRGSAGVRQRPLTLHVDAARSRPASRCLSAKASCASARGSGSSSSSSTASATAAGSCKSSGCSPRARHAPRPYDSEPRLFPTRHTTNTNRHCRRGDAHASPACDRAATPTTSARHCRRGDAHASPACAARITPTPNVTSLVLVVGMCHEARRHAASTHSRGDAHRGRMWRRRHDTADRPLS